MNTADPQVFVGRDGLPLVYREVGAGRALVLIHGYFSTAIVNWVRYGHAAALAERGYRVVLPDLRGHGDSSKSHDPAAYPPDVLAADGAALVEHLGFGDGEYDLGGYSLGGRTVIRMLALGARPRRAVIAGMGLAGIVDANARTAHFRHVLTNLGSHPPRSPQWLAEAFLKTVGGDPQALLGVAATFVDTPAEVLAGLQTPTLVVLGEEDDDNGDGPALAAALGAGTFRAIPGNHMSAVTKPDLAAAIADYLG